ncbi:MAG: ARMT1-like domain-containing protein [candidate division KSB1 bacterium]|nr:ARMT1-like domain-containing protein [candidate division KSB1 bacterium]
MMQHHDELKKMINTADDPFNMALRIAMAGNVIDFGAQEQLDIRETLDRVVHSDLAIDDSERLRSDLKTAETVLYVGDNCGEIVLDELFVEAIAHPNLYFAVRGAPVLNDATLDDAKMVGLNEKAQIITTGDNAPGAVWENVSEEFRSVFKKRMLSFQKARETWKD